MRNLTTIIIMWFAVTLTDSVSIANDDWHMEAALDPEERSTSAFSDDPYRQFDFWIGDWTVNLRMRQADFSWQDEVAARARIYSILNGKAILELWDSKPIKGYSLRYFDPESQKWKLWLNWPGKNRSNASTLDGAFRHGRGDFIGQYEDHEGNAVIERYSFNDIGRNHLRWDDHASIDGGDTWRDNWRMEWTRLALEPEWPIAGSVAPTYDNGDRCDAPEFRAHERLTKHLYGTLERAAGAPARNAELRGFRVLDGCAVMLFIRSEGEEWFWFNFFNSANEHWESHFLSSHRGEALVRLRSGDDDFRLTSESGDIEHGWRFDGNDLVLNLRNRILGNTKSFRFQLD